MADTRIHDLKTHPAMYDDVVMGRKQFEVRKDDRGFKVGDVLRLHSWPADKGRDCLCSTSSCGSQTRRMTVKVLYILRGGEWGIEPGHVVMGIAPVSL